MYRICFICLGNICRSPMAEFIMKSKVNKLNIASFFTITSKATISEEYGNDIYPPVKEILLQNNIPFTKHFASKITKNDYDNYDYFICMDDYNVSSLKKIFENDYDHKIVKLLPKDIEDPYFTRNFLQVYNEIDKGIDELISTLKIND